LVRWTLGSLLRACLLCRALFDNSDKAGQAMLACCCGSWQKVSLKGLPCLGLQLLLVPLAQERRSSQLLWTEVALALLQLVALQLLQGLLHPAPVVLCLQQPLCADTPVCCLAGVVLLLQCLGLLLLLQPVDSNGCRHTLTANSRCRCKAF
jgi:hypothetical protein